MTGFGPEDGGLTIHRPLIPFPKSRLIATCKAAGVQWVEDESNYDVTFTGRNAVRRLLNEDVLPRALSPDSLFSLAETVRSCRNQEEIFVNTIYEATTITFDTRSGVLTAQVPRLAQIFKDGWYAWPAKARRRITARYLQLLGQSVVAHEVVRMTTLISVEAAGTIFASDFTDPEQKDKHKTTPSAPSSTSASKVVEFVREAGGVLFWHNPAATGSESEGRLWTFSRPLCDAGNGPGPVHFPPDDTNESRLPSKQDNMDTFKLWDGRFWINLYNTGPRAVSIVMLRPKQLSRLRGELPSMVKKKLNVLLKDAAPGKIRYTLPAIAIMSNLKMWSEEDMDNAQIIALPTLGIILEEWRGKITWDIRYKKLGLSGLKETIGQGGETINYKLEKIASKEGKYISS
ncbi:hypothetical protein MMC10_000873 [Thelotrema lepadinum]|nr:hypothetical protein [Thelotrema lepadinum]